MDAKHELENKAKSLIISNPNEAIKLYMEIWESFPDDFNEWDAFYSMKTLRVSTSPDLNWAEKLAERFKNEKVNNLYGWLIFDRCVKGKTGKEVINNEKHISGLISFCLQKNLKEDDSYPCPTTISILKLCDAHAENLFNAGKINDLLSKLDFNLLSDKSKSIETPERGVVQFSSDLEKYFALKTKALLKLGDFENCKKYCRTGLEVIDKFNYNNDLWFKMRIALSEDKMGNHEISESIFQELLKSRAGNDKWFLYRDIAELYFEQKEYVKAWKYAVDAAFYGNEPHFLIGLYLLQARILVKLERSEEGMILAELIAAILNEQGWNDKLEYSRLFSFYKVDKTAVLSTREIIKKAQLFWQKERYGNNQKLKGTIISIHKNGKVGRIKDQNGNVVEFHKKNLVRKMKGLETLKGASAEFFEVESYEGNMAAESIEILEPAGLQPPNVSAGETVTGIIKNITDFGIFVSIEGFKDGLIHKNNMPDSLKASFAEKFAMNQKIKVVIIKFTDKGPQLKLS